MSFKDCTVVSYFINVQVGDGAVHLLIHENKPIKATLIDGGKNSATDDVRSAIEALYIEHGVFKFTSIVVSHWDDDHSGGLVQLLYEDVKDTAEKDWLYVDKNTTFYCPKTRTPTSGQIYVKDGDLMTGSGQNARNVCRAVVGPYCLGYDFFTGSKIDGTTDDQYFQPPIPNLAGVYQRSQMLSQQSQPIFLCVGVDEYLINEQLQPLEAKHPSKNDSSIMAIVIWPKMQRHRISLYTGGDAEEHLERRLIGWLGPAADCQLDVIKAGHHGSRAATPEELIDFGLQGFIISAGDQYGHPSAALVIYLLLVAHHLHSLGKKRFDILAMRRPYWLDEAANDLDSVALNFGTFLDYSADAVALYQGIKKLCGNDLSFYELLQEAALYIKSHVYLKIGDEIDTHDQKFNGDSPLAQLKDWSKNLNWGGRNSDEFLFLAKQATCTSIGLGWNQLGQPSMLTAKKVQFIISKALSNGQVELGLYPDPALAITVRDDFIQANHGPKRISVFKERLDVGPSALTSSKNFYSRKRDNDVEAGRKEKRKATLAAKRGFGKPPNAKLAAPSANGDDKIVSVAAWTVQQFTAELASRQDALPDVLDRFRHGLGDGSNWCKWFEQCFPGFSASLMFTGKHETDETLSLEQIDLELVPQHQRGSQPVLTFSTAHAARVAQFGDDAADGEGMTKLGFHRELEGILFALDPAQGSQAISLADVANLVGLPLSPTVKGILGDLSLRPRSTANARSGIWVIPCHDSRTIMRLALEPAQDTTGVSVMEGLLNGSLGSIALNKMMVSGICVSEYPLIRNVEATGTLSVQADVSWVSDDTAALPVLGFGGTVCLKFMKQGFEAILTLKKSSGTKEELGGILGKFQKKMAASGSSIMTNQDPGEAASQIETMLQNVMTSGIHIRSIAMVFDEEKKPIAFQTNLEVGLPLNGGEKIAPFLVTFEWKAGEVRLLAQLWDDPWYGGIPASLYPYHEPAMQLEAWTAVKYDGGISIKDLVKQPDLQLPSGIPDTIYTASMSLSHGHGVTTLSLVAGLSCDAPETLSGASNASKVPVLWFDEVKLDLGMRFHSGKNGNTRVDFSISFDTAITLYTAPKLRRNFKVSDEIHMRVRVQYVRDGSGGSNWSVMGEVDNVKIANLYDMFAEDGSNEAIMDLMAGITIAQASVQYDYHSGRPSQLQIHGKLLLGPPSSTVELDLTYSHGKDGKDDWSFQGVLGLVDKSKIYRVANLLSGLVEDEAALPEVVRNMEIPLGQLQLDLSCYSTTNHEGTGRHAIFALTIQLGNKLTITFVQVRSYGVDAKSSRPGRLLRFSLSGFSQVGAVPVVGNVQLPFDQLGIVWANCELSPIEMDVLNEHVFKGSQRLLIKENKPNSETRASFEQGLHFQVQVLEQSAPKLILDHVVGRKKADKDEMENDTLGSSTNNDEADAGGQSVAPLVKTVGPLSVSNVGLSVQGPSFSQLKVSLDAMVRLGPLAFALLGFAITIDLSGIKSLDSLSNVSLKPSVRGMAAAFDKPPTRIAGTFVSFGEEGDDSRGFEGAVAVSVAAWSAIAGGVYEESKAGTKSFFVFGMLQGPIAEFGAAEIRGLTGGYGYNSHLSLPGLDNVADFPFITMIGQTPSSGGPLGSLRQLMGQEGDQGACITAVPGATWFVAGVGLKAFQTIEAQAVIALTLSDQPKFALLAHASAVFPKTSKPSSSTANPWEGAFALLDLVVRAVVDPAHGTIIAIGKLTPRSFILHPSCRLTGGFALAFFLPGSDHDGDWVFSVGGYHPHFDVPAHYPAVASRVGITWQYDSSIYISGEAYFALTPQAAMGGGRLDLVFDVGWLRVVFSAYANFFMHFHPFYFEAAIGIALYASVTIPCLLFTLHLGPLEFSADLVLRGPPVAGEAHLRLWRWDITVCFGPPPAPPPRLDLKHFIRMVKNVPQEADDSDIPIHLLTITQGSVTPQRVSEISKAGTTEIRGSRLRFEVRTRVPVLSAMIGQEDRHDMVRQGAELVAPRIFSRPMQTRKSFAESHLVIKMVHTGTNEQVSLRGKPLLKDMPPALWGEYLDSPDAAVSEPLLQHVMGYSIEVPHQPASTEGMPAISLTGSNMIDVGQGESVIPPIPPVQVLEGDDGFVFKASGARNELFELESVEDAPKPNAATAAREAALTAWRRFKGKYSRGGSSAMMLR